MEMQAKLDQDASLKLLIRTPAGLAPSPYNDILEQDGEDAAAGGAGIGFLAGEPDTGQGAAPARGGRSGKSVGHAAADPRRQAAGGLTAGPVALVEAR